MCMKLLAFNTFTEKPEFTLNYFVSQPSASLTTTELFYFLQFPLRRIEFRIFMQSVIKLSTTTQGMTQGPHSFCVKLRRLRCTSRAMFHLSGQANGIKLGAKQNQRLSFSALKNFKSNVYYSLQTGSGAICHRNELFLIHFLHVRQHKILHNGIRRY